MGNLGILILTAGTAVMGGWLASKCKKITGGIMIGSLLFVAVLNICFGAVWLPKISKTVIQAASGIFIGMKVTAKEYKLLSRFLKPALLIVCGMMMFCLLIGITVNQISDYDMITSLLSCAPGGIMDVSLIAQDMNANVSVVSLAQVIRYAVVVGVFPPVLAELLSLTRKAPEQEHISNSEKDEDPSGCTAKNRWENAVLTCLIAGIGGYLGMRSGLPAGAMLFSIIGCGVLNLATGRTYLPSKGKEVLQIAAGALIGYNITLDALVGLKNFYFPMLLVLAGYFISCLLIAGAAHVFGGLDLMTAILASIPGGAAEISLVADDYGANATQVAFIQIVRSISIIVLYPICALGIATLME